MSLDAVEFKVDDMGHDFQSPHLALVYKSRPTAAPSLVRARPRLLKTLPGYLHHHWFL